MDLLGSVLHRESTGPAGPAGRVLRPLLLVTLILGYFWIALRTSWVSDDAYVTVRTIFNFLHGNGLRWNIDERVQAYTHPLWMFVLAIATHLSREYFYTAIVVGLVVSIAAVLVLARGMAVSLPQACFGIACLTLSKAFVDYSTAGLENPLTHLLLAVFFWLYFRFGAAARGRLFLVAALLVGNRMDTGLLVLPALALVAWQSPWRATVKAALLGGLPFILWEAFSLLYYGFPFPNTAYAKLGTGIGGGELASQGLRYFANSLRLDPLTLLTTAAGGGVAILRRLTPARAAAAGIALHLIYIVTIGGDFMSGRFFTPPFFVAVVILVHARLAPRLAWIAFAAVVLAGVLLPSSLRGVQNIYKPDGQPVPEVAIDAWGICDERSYYDYCARFRRVPNVPWPDPESAELAADLRNEWRTDEFAGILKQLGVMSPQDPWPEASQQAGAQIRTPVGVRGAIGFFGYYAGPGIHLLDYHALADPLLARLPAIEHDPLLGYYFPKLAMRKWRIGHFVRRIPEGYFATLATGHNVIRDPDLAAYYDKLALVTRGNLLDPARLRAIWDLNLRHPVEVERYLERAGH